MKYHSIPICFLKAARRVLSLNYICELGGISFWNFIVSWVYSEEKGGLFILCADIYIRQTSSESCAAVGLLLRGMLFFSNIALVIRDSQIVKMHDVFKTVIRAWTCNDSVITPLVYWKKVNEIRGSLPLTRARTLLQVRIAAHAKKSNFSKVSFKDFIAWYFINIVQPYNMSLKRKKKTKQLLGLKVTLRVRHEL